VRHGQAESAYCRPLPNVSCWHKADDFGAAAIPSAFWGTSDVLRASAALPFMTQNVPLTIRQSQSTSINVTLQLRFNARSSFLLRNQVSPRKANSITKLTPEEALPMTFSETLPEA
jgi:hypothetical protein